MRLAAVAARLRGRLLGADHVEQLEHVVLGAARDALAAELERGRCPAEAEGNLPAREAEAQHLANGRPRPSTGNERRITGGAGIDGAHPAHDVGARAFAYSRLARRQSSHRHFPAT